MTIDQSAMWVVDGRMGMWAAGRHLRHRRRVDARGDEPDRVAPRRKFTGFPTHDPVRRLHGAKKRGLKLIVVDPRRTEVAAQADIHLQLRPGTDVALFASLLHVLLRDGFQDDAFVARWVDGFDDLRAAVASWTPELAAARCDVPVADIEAAARMFGAASRGMALSGTGPDMGPDANLAEHLIRSLNVVCGRYLQEGDAVAGQAVLGSAKSPPGMAIGPDRTWERGYRSRFGFGLLQRELPTGSLPAESLEPGPHQVRALFVSGANPASAIPDQARDPRVARAARHGGPLPERQSSALRSPVMHLERPDIRIRMSSSSKACDVHAADRALRPTPSKTGSSGFAAGGQATSRPHHSPGSPVPTTDEVLASMATRGRVTCDEVQTHPHRKIYDEFTPPVVGPPTEGTEGRFALLASDVADELAAARATTLATETVDDEHPFRLVVRRTKETINSLGTSAGLLVTPTTVLRQPRRPRGARPRPARSPHRTATSRPSCRPTPPSAAAWCR